MRRPRSPPRSPPGLLTAPSGLVGLQTTRLGNHLEDRVNKFLRRQNHPEAGEVFVRVVASSDKTVEVKPGMKSRFVRSLPPSLSLSP